MTLYSHPFTASATQKSDSAFDDLSASLGDQRPHPTEEALVQLGRALMTELVDVISDTALEDYKTILGETLIGAFHSAAARIERDADRARDTMRSLDRDFDGSEAADTELQEATAKARSGDAATQACELIRDAASETWTVATGEVWTAWRGSRRGSLLTAAQLEAKQAIRAIRWSPSGARRRPTRQRMRGGSSMPSTGRSRLGLTWSWRRPGRRDRRSWRSNGPSRRG